MTTDATAGRIRPIKIEDEMRASYLDYAMSVIVSRALPDVRDGLKPVQRRILYAMSELGLRPNAAYKKSARIVGEVLGKYHPHGDDPVYEAMVRMAQDFSMRYRLVDGQGNFGSIDGDPAAAMRYTEARLTPHAEEMLADIDRDTVDFGPNFDDSLREPIVLPARLPNLLVNGAYGIAVGMATNVPPHNLSEICDALALLIDKPDAAIDEITKVVKGPDFPTGGLIFRYERTRKDGTEARHDAIQEAYRDGRGRVVMRARTHIEESRSGRQQIIVSELPYMTNKAALVERIADLARSKRIDGISDLRDESDRHGMRIVIEVSRAGQAQQVLNQLYRHTAMQSSFPINMLALVDNQPRTLSLRRTLEHYIAFRREVIRRRSQFELEKAREREHILQGLLKALENLDAVIQAIRRAQSAEQAKERLMKPPFKMSDRQAQAVLDMQLRRLARLERQKIEEEYAQIIQQIAYLEDLLANPRKIDFLIKEDAQDIKKRYGDSRRTQIIDQEVEEFSEEDLVPHQEVVITLSSRGYIKRLPLETYRLQRRGGRGITGMVTREADAVSRLLVADTHDSLLFFTQRGRVFQLKAYEVPDAKRQARGIPLVNLIELAQGDLVTAMIGVRSFEKDFLVLATARGEVKKTALSEFESVRRAGLIAMDLEEGDELITAKQAAEDDHVVLVSGKGKSVRFSVKELRSASRMSGGVRGISLAKDDSLVSMEVVAVGRQLLTVTANGFGKRTAFEEYTVHHRGGEGLVTHRTTDKTGTVVVARTVHGDQELILVSRNGIILRTRVDSIPIVGRAAQGVTLMGVGPGDAVASIASIDVGKAPARAPARKKGQTVRAKAARGEGGAGKAKPRSQAPGGEERSSRQPGGRPKSPPGAS
ncbi:MAG: DNA gyrase subunit A [Dehalococcoidia bacterium]|nr:DNA gyrase subunit A [Dehalococcoidia bacterium]